MCDVSIGGANQYDRHVFLLVMILKHFTQVPDNHFSTVSYEVHRIAGIKQAYAN